MKLKLFNNLVFISPDKDLVLDSAHLIKIYFLIPSPVEMNTIAMMRNTINILNIQPEVDILKVSFSLILYQSWQFIWQFEERNAYLEAFMAFDKGNNGVISTKNLIHALRRVGLNPTEVRQVLNPQKPSSVQNKL